MSSPLKISVIMPSFNQGQFLEKSLRSVLDQNYPNLEFIVMDGGSDDGSVEILERYADRLHYWHSKPDKGQSDAINQGMAMATGDVLCWLNSDDLHLPETLQRVARHFENHPECQWLIGAGQFVDADGKPMWSVQLPESINPASMANWYDNNMFHQPSVFWRRSLWNDAGPLREDFHLAMDFELWLRFLQRFPPVLERDLLSLATDHEDMKTRQCWEASYAENCHALFLNGFDKEGRRAVENLATRAFALKRRLYPLSRLRVIRWALIRFNRA